MNKQTKPVAWSGFTVVELMIVIVIMALVAAMAVPAYRNVVKGAQVKSAVSDLESASNAIDMYLTQTGELPGSLADVGLQDLVDPWGNPYVYLPLSFTEEETVEAIEEESQSGGWGSSYSGSGSWDGSTSASTSYSFSSEGSSETFSSSGDFTEDLTTYLEAEEEAGRERPLLRALLNFLSGMSWSDGDVVDLSDLPEDERRSLQRNYGDGRVLNSDFDFYSLGPDVKSTPDITTPESADDVVRSTNGNYMGPVSGLLDD